MTFSTTGNTNWQVQSLPPQNLPHGFHWSSFPSLKAIQIPLATLVLIFVSIGAIPWFPWSSFSLRTMLIAVTLVAAILGIIAISN
jgi:hypothetical protein